MFVKVRPRKLLVNQFPEGSKPCVKVSRTKISETSGQQLVSGLFSDSEIDPDLKFIIEHWPRLSVELRQAVVKMVR